jgi:hypothetical protein
LELEGEVEFSAIQVEWCKRLIDGGKSVGQVALIMSLQQWHAARLMSACGKVVELAPSEDEIREMTLRIRRREIVIPGSDRIKREAGFWLVTKKEETAKNGT